MAFVIIKPSHRAGHRSPAMPKVQIGSDGVMILSAATLDLLGNPQRCLVEYDADSGVVQLSATTSQDYTGWRISGGGNAPGRISLRKFARLHHGVIGEYSVTEIESGTIQLNKRVL